MSLYCYLKRGVIFRNEELDQEGLLPFHIAELQTKLLANSKIEEGKPSVLYMVYVRNRLLNMLANCLSHSNPEINKQ